MAVLLAAPASAAAPSITAAQLDKLRAAAVAKEIKPGPSFFPGPELCNALKIPVDAKDPYKAKYVLLAAAAGSDGFERSFGYSKQADGYVLILTTKSHIYYLRIDPAAEPAAGASYKLRSSMEYMSDREVSELVERELVFWARYSDAMPNPL
jgi:hypothetical protein